LGMGYLRWTVFESSQHYHANQPVYQLPSGYW
jgi:hypothetical protein